MRTILRGCSAHDRGLLARDGLLGGIRELKAALILSRLLDRVLVPPTLSRTRAGRGLTVNAIRSALGLLLVAGTIHMASPRWSAGGVTDKPAGLNPLLIQQKPGTWMRLPRGSGPTPRRIPRHAGGVIDPATSILYFFGSDNHGDEWNNEVWRYDPVAMAWTQSYPEDAPSTYLYLDGRKTTTTGHPWAMHTFAMNAWDAAGGRLVMGAWQMHYGLESLPQVKLPRGAPESWWQYEPVGNAWTPAAQGPDLGLGHLCYVPSLGRVIGFSGDNIPVTLYDPAKRTFEAFSGFFGKAPDGYTLRSAYDSRRDRILLVSWDKGPNVWAFDLKKKRWSNLGVQHRPRGGIYGSWDYDQSADAIVSLWPDDPAGGFSNESGKSRTFLVDLGRNAYTEIRTDPAPPYTGLSFRVLYDPRHEVTFAVEGNEVWSFKAPSLAANRPF